MPGSPQTSTEASARRTAPLQCAAGYVKHLGRLTLGDTLGVQSTIPRKQVRAFEASPALVAIIIVTLLVLDYRFHSSLLFQPFACKS
jgi:hypothetical protein